ncbi:MAG: C13 family peptidase [Cypionkella sp.]
MSEPTPNRFIRNGLIALLSVVLAWFAEYLCQKAFYASEDNMAFEIYLLSGPLALAAITCLAVLIGCLLLRRQDLLTPAIITAFIGAAIASPLTWGYLHYVGGYPSDEPEAQTVHLQMLALTLLPSALALLWLGWRSTRRWALTPVLALSYIAIMALNDRYIASSNMLLDYQYDETAAAEYPRVDVEELYLSQPDLMAKQISALAPQTPGKPETYALLLGGTANQSVFRSEVEKVDSILAAQIGANHSLRLVNDDKDSLAYPLANRANLEAGLTALAKTMGPEDTAFLYLTSHGCEKFLSLSFYQADTSNLTPDDFAAILRRSGLGPTVIVIGACHAGTFIPALQAPDRVIITAARADRTSFGCSDGREWTEFGQSFFDLALRAEPDPRKAFEIARKDVQAKEFWAWRRASLPQMVVGDVIAARLDQQAPPS